MISSTIRISSDFSRVPAGRYRRDGRFSGERFRDDFLVKALHEHQRITVNLDGTEGFGSSFLEEAFGGLVRVRHLSSKELHQRLLLVSRDKAYITQIWNYIDTASREPRQNAGVA